MQKHKIKTKIFVLFFALFMLSLTACDGIPFASQNTSSENDNTLIGVNDPTDLQAMTGDNYLNDDKLEEDISLSGVLYDFTFKLDDDYITLPLTLEKFLSYGWESRFALKETIISGGQGNVTLVKNGKKVSVMLNNTSADEIPIIKGIIFEIDCNSYDESDDEYINAVIEIPKGIILGKSTKDEVIKAFGYPTSLNENEGFLEDNDIIDVMIYSDQDLQGEKNHFGSGNGYQIITSREKGDVIIQITITNSSQR